MFRILTRSGLRTLTLSQKRTLSLTANTLKRQRITSFINQPNQLQISQYRYNAITASTDGTKIPDDVRNLTLEKYHNTADATFEILITDLDTFFEESRIMEADVDEEAGVMEINCSEGTYIINKQPPTKQIWLSSPISGPKRFDLHDDQWICLRDNVKLCDLLSNEMNMMYSNFEWSQTF